MTLIGVFWTTHDESRPLQHKDASRHEPASVCSNIDINIKHQMMHFTFDFTFILTETFIVDWHFLCPPFMALPTIEKIDTFSFLHRKSSFSLSNFQFLLCLFSHLNTFCLSFTISFSWVAALFSFNFQPISRCFFMLSVLFSSSSELNTASKAWSKESYKEFVKWHWKRREERLSFFSFHATKVHNFGFPSFYTNELNTLSSRKLKSFLSYSPFILTGNLSTPRFSLGNILKVFF